MGPKIYKKKNTSTYTKNTTNKPAFIPSTDRYPSAKYLIIVESPSKCAKIESYLGQEYQCISSKGHIRELNGLKSIDIKNGFEPTFQIIEEKKSHIEWMKKIIDQFEKKDIIIAADDDREGEAIAYHICEVFELSLDTTIRILFHEITKPALLESIKHPTIINMDLVRAQRARQILDVLVGFKISPLLWKYIYHAKSNSLSAGRCQTPTLRLIYDNEMAKSKESLNEIKYKTAAHFFQQNVKFDLNHEFLEKTDIQTFLEKSKGFEYKLSLGEKRLSKSSPPKPFNTSRLLQVSSNILHYSPKQTMHIAQQLYQEGYITYMRTENTKYSHDFLEIAKDYITKEYGSVKFLGNLDILENQEDKINPHEAIRITSLKLHKLDEKADQHTQSLYRLIWKNTLESCMSDYESNHYKVTIPAPDMLEYHYVLEIPVFLGWKKVASNSTQPDQFISTTTTGQLLHFQTLAKIQSPIQPNYIESTVTVQNKHSHYTEASLIQKMEQLGIGRPSTFSSLVETIQERGYVKCANLEGILLKCEEFKLRGEILEKTIIEKTFGNEKNKLVIQPTGILCIEFLLKHFQKIFSYDYTKNMEDELDKISNPESNIAKPWYSICQICNDEIAELSKPVAKIEKQQYTIDENHTLVFNPYGASIKRKPEIEGGDIEYLPVKKSLNIDLDKLKKGEYTLEDLLEFDNSLLGKYEDQDLFLCIGKYGNYVKWGDNNKSIRDIDIPLKDIKLADVEKYLAKEKETVFEPDPLKEYSREDHPSNSKIVRILNNSFSIRKGKYGNYVYYKTGDMKTPKFLDIKKCKLNVLECDINILLEWICETNKIAK